MKKLIILSLLCFKLQAQCYEPKFRVYSKIEVWIPDSGFTKHSVVGVTNYYLNIQNNITLYGSRLRTFLPLRCFTNAFNTVYWAEDTDMHYLCFIEINDDQAVFTYQLNNLTFRLK